MILYLYATLMCTIIVMILSFRYGVTWMKYLLIFHFGGLALYQFYMLVTLVYGLSHGTLFTFWCRFPLLVSLLFFIIYLYNHSENGLD